MDGDSQKDHVTIDLHGALCRLVTPDEWRTMSEEGRLRFINTRHGYVVGTLQDHSLVAVKDLFSPIAVDTPMPLQDLDRCIYTEVLGKYIPKDIPIPGGQSTITIPRYSSTLAFLEIFHKFLANGYSVQFSRPSFFLCRVEKDGRVWESRGDTEAEGFCRCALAAIRKLAEER